MEKKLIRLRDINNCKLSKLTNHELKKLLTETPRISENKCKFYTSKLDKMRSTHGEEYTGFGSDTNNPSSHVKSDSEGFGFDSNEDI